MSYAIISLGGKQYRVQPGERLLVDQLKADAGKTFEPRVLLVGGNGKADLSPSTTVTARVVEHVLGEKIRIGKYKPKSGYKKHTGYRSRLTRIEIEAIGSAKAPAKKEPPKAQATPDPKAEAPARAKAEPKATAETAPAPARTAHPPKGYDELTVAQIAEAAPGWRRPNLEAALEHEKANANRKGAIAALESALAAKEQG
jgi:large subunit ribosomal protein L21